MRADELSGMSSPEACRRAGITFRQLDWWVRTGLIAPSVRAARGCGTRRRWSDDDVRILAAMARVDPLQRRLIASAMSMSTCKPDEPCPPFLVISDGLIQKCWSAEEVVLFTGSGMSTVVCL